jgi:hypothetical protein
MFVSHLVILIVVFASGISLGLWLSHCARNSLNSVESWLDEKPNQHRYNPALAERAKALNLRDSV